MTLPQFDELDGGKGWGVWDQDGEQDQFGTLNLLTAETKLAAAKEIREGISVSLNWSLDKPTEPVFGRQRFQHTIIDNNTFSASASFDDVVSINTQSSSQWDGLRHVVHSKTGLLYNGVSKDEVETTDKLGLQVWHPRGGVVGRGVLVDYVAYATRHGITYSATEQHSIGLDELQEAAHEQKLEFRTGDILIVRSGLTKWYNETQDEGKRNAYFTKPDKAGVGVGPVPETIAWVWNNHFAAVAGDALAWEPIPYPKSSPSFHQYLLASWGTPIGELWDLEELSKVCARLGRYSFFLTSIPLNVPGGVASPPNAIAIF